MSNNQPSDRGVLAYFQHILEIAEKRNIVLSKMSNELKEEDVEIERAEGFYSYIVSERLEDCIEAKNWFVGVMLSASILDDMGKRKLKRKFRGQINAKKIENSQLEETIMLLFASNLIDARTYERMMDVKNFRNELAHNSWEALFTLVNAGGDIEDKSCQKSRAVIRKAIKCIEALSPKVIP